MTFPGYQLTFPVAAAQAIEMGASPCPRDIEAELVLPETPADGKGRGPSLVIEQQSRRVFDRETPDLAGYLCFDPGDRAEQEKRQVYQVHTLVEQFTATGEPGIGSPFPA